MSLACEQKQFLGEEGSLEIKQTRSSLHFDPADVSTTAETISFAAVGGHNFYQGDAVVFTAGANGATLPTVGGTAVSTTTAYFVHVVDANLIKLTANLTDLTAGTFINFDGAGTGKCHRLSVKDPVKVLAIKMWNMDVRKAVLERTKLGDKARRYGGGMLEGSGSMTLYYDSNEADGARRLIGSIFAPYDPGDSMGKFYLFEDDVTPANDRYIEVPILIESGGFRVEPGTDQMVTVNFRTNGDFVRSPQF